MVRARKTSTSATGVNEILSFCQTGEEKFQKSLKQLQLLQLVSIRDKQSNTVTLEGEQVMGSRLMNRSFRINSSKVCSEGCGGMTHRSSGTFSRRRFGISYRCLRKQKEQQTFQEKCGGKLK